MSRISNWLLAIGEHLPEDIAELKSEIVELERQRTEKLILLTDYEDLLVIARRRIPAQVTVSPPRDRPMLSESVAA